MYCPKCGKQMVYGAKFCPEDGAELPISRRILTRDKPEMRAEGGLPYYRDLPPKYEKPEKKRLSAGAMILVWIMVGIGIFIVVSSLNNIQTGGTCPITPTCGDQGLGSVIPPGCTCPSACNKYFIIHNPPSMDGWKQCHR
jgi:hypothetical protein